MQCILTVRYDLQFASKLRHLRGQFKKARTDGISVKLPPQKQIVSTDMEVEGDRGRSQPEDPEMAFPVRLMRRAEGYTCLQYDPELSVPDKGAKR